MVSDLRPTSEHGEVYRDAEYKRLGTLSLLAGIDLLTGEAIPLVSETHKSSDFIEFLKILDKKYPSQDTIRIILDNHSAHTSKCELPKINPLNAGFHPNNYAKFTCPACLQAYSVLFCSSSDVSPEVINARISS